jgi:hypothetical protein
VKKKKSFRKKETQKSCRGRVTHGTGRGLIHHPIEEEEAHAHHNQHKQHLRSGNNTALCLSV